MATYAIGDIQGCFDTLAALVDRIGFDERVDRLWLAGDLVNRGPGSLEVLRWARDLGDRAVCVLGNHDVHLLARAAGVARRKRRDTLDRVLEAPDADELVAWLRHRPLFHREAGWALVHAGLHPSWTVEQAGERAAEVERELAGPGWTEVVAGDGRAAPPWRPDLTGLPRWRSILSALVKLRTCTDDGAPCSSFSGPPEDAPRGCHPWFSHPRRQAWTARIAFGHWAALGFRRGGDYLALDSGCVWGNALTAVRLEDGAVFQQPAVAGDPLEP